VQGSIPDEADPLARVVAAGCQEGAEGVVRIQMIPQPRVSTDGHRGVTRTTRSEIETGQHEAPHPPDTAEADRVRGDQVWTTLHSALRAYVAFGP
jgi:hypothetical protein